MSQSKIFLRNRALGYVSNEVPHVTRYIQRRKEFLIVTCVGKSFHTYGCSHFTLLTVSGLHPEDITCMAADTFHVYTASGNKVYAWRRGNELKHTYSGHESTVHSLLPFGPHLLSVDEDSCVRVWDVKSEESVVELNFNNSIFKITKMVHLDTYINKILFGSEQGQMQLWNIKTVKMIYTFKGWGSMISALEPAPAIHVVAVGLANGKIILHNLEVDETIFELVQDWGLVTSISFRTGRDEPPIMATGTQSGHIVIWDLDKRKVESQISNAHIGSVSGLSCLTGHPLMVSSSPDNSLKLWIFDQTDGGARLLRIREGYAEPPTFLRFHGSDGDNILTAGEDSSMRIFSTVTETFNKSLGRAHKRKTSQKKGRAVEDSQIMRYITRFASETTRGKEWDNIVATHQNSQVVTTWSYDKLKMGEHKLYPIFEKPRDKSSNSAIHKSEIKSSICATSVCLTHCGNFVVIGYNNGWVQRFNIQSGIHRATYGEECGAHIGPVTGVTVDPLNQIVATAGKDAKLKFWTFNKPHKEPKTQLSLDDSVEFMRTHRDNSIFALALQDFSIILVDMDTRRVIRKFVGHTNVLNDATFSPDARWLITASRDCTIRTWDIPSAHLIDIFQVPEACKSLDFSPTGEFLATTHVGNLGIYLWSNRTIFSHVSLKAIRPDADVPVISLPGADADRARDEPEVEDEDEYKSPEQLSEDLITMSSLANSRWQNLLDIDIVKKRNKPLEPPKAPEAAPFFLPTIPSLEPQFDFSDIKVSEDRSKFGVHSDFQSLTIFSKILLSSIQTDEFSKAVEKLKLLGPSGIDFEIQSLSLDPGCSTELMLQFLKMIRSMMESKKDFELAQAYLALFLKSHGETITEEKTLLDYLTELQIVQQESWAKLREQLFYTLSVVQHLKKK